MRSFGSYITPLIGNIASLPFSSKNKKREIRNKIRYAMDPENEKMCNQEKIISDYLTNQYINKRIAEINRESITRSEPQPDNEKIVWQYWAQGAEKCPDIIKICLNSVKRHFEPLGYQVRVIDDRTVHQYVDINPSYRQIASAGKGYGLAAYSDLLRYALLYQHGGIWLDATIFISGKADFLLSNERVFFERLSSTPKALQKKMACFSSNYFRWGNNVRCNWLNSIIKTPKNDRLMGILFSILNEYWSNESEYIHYFMSQILFDEIKRRRKIPNYPATVLDDTYPHLLQAALAKNENYDEITKILSSYPIHKLTYRFGEEVTSDPNSAYSKFLRDHQTAYANSGNPT